MTLHALLENPQVYAFTQRLNPMTVSLYRSLVRRHVRVDGEAAVLDIGCGVGAHQPLFPDAQYVGIDVNPAYVRRAQAVARGRFLVMDAGALEFPPASFDAVFTVATCHHMDDARVLAMTEGALRVLRPGGLLHVVDPVLPVSRRAVLKQALFQQDRGQFQRTVEQLTGLLGRVAHITCVDVRSGLAHDVCYVGMRT